MTGTIAIFRRPRFASTVVSCHLHCQVVNREEGSSKVEGPGTGDDIDGVRNRPGSTVRRRRGGRSGETAMLMWVAW